MPAYPIDGDQIAEIYESRRAERDAQVAVYDEIEQAILNGTLPQDYMRLFTERDVLVQLRTLRAADDSLTKFLTEIPILPHVDHLGKRETDTARNKAELVENITRGWYNGSAMRGGVDFDGIRFQLATHQVRFADGCVVVHPDFHKKIVYLEVLDPRFHFPPKGYSPFSPMALDGTLLMFERTLGEVKALFGYDANGNQTPNLVALRNAFASSSGPAGEFRYDENTKVRLAIYRSRAAWLTVAFGNRNVILHQSRRGEPGHPGVTGVMSLAQYGRGPLMAGQLGIEAAAMKVLNQQIQNTERINKATTYGPPLLGSKVVGGYNEINYALLQGRSAQFYREAPDSPTNLTQVLSQLMGLAQMFNYTPDSFLGSGEANSGKAIQQLQAGPRTLITNILFSPYKPAFTRIHDDCLEMELNLWPNDRKKAVGYKGRQRFEVEYTPSTALQGYKGHIKIEDARAGGYNAFLEAVQKKDAGMASLRDVLERDPDIEDVEATLRRIDGEQVDRYISAAFEALGTEDPRIAIRASIEVGKRIAAGKTKTDAIAEVLETGILDPPVPEEMAGLPGGAPPGLPPELAGLLGAGAPPAGVPPSLEELRAG